MENVKNVLLAGKKNNKDFLENVINKYKASLCLIILFTIKNNKRTIRN